ncbi:hypothetical protein EG68_02586 [Paragonimus skrjabini miyazakii]|uniref:LIM zinc-binding domain-containing protein n=1 Tax=Paragonimus skrjabini miyazakii TaxID=59628 RepID=A0A8S9YXX8_9TREM|nr:hypothetical protein EG68_02586 [Paragonimus skrjabini miyazakii]
MRNKTVYCFACREPVEEWEGLCVVDRLCHRSCFKCQICQQVLDSRMFCVIMGEMFCERHYAEMLSSKMKLIDASRSNRKSASNDHLERHPSIHKCACKATCFICGRIVDEPDPLRGLSGPYHGGCFRCSCCRTKLDIDNYKVVRGKLQCEPFCSAPVNGLTNGEKNIVSRTTGGQQTHYKEELILAGSGSQFDLKEEGPVCHLCCSDEPETFRPPNPTPGQIGSPTNKHRPMSTPSSKNTSPAHRSTTIGLPAFLPNNSDSPPTCVANPDKVAKIQRQLEKIQLSALEDMNCYTCGKKVYVAEQLNILNRIYHVKCFQCKFCKKPLGSTKYQIVEGNPYCIPHSKMISSMKSSSMTNLVAAIGQEESKKDDTSLPSNSHPKIPVQTSNPVITNESEIFQPEPAESTLCYVCSKKVYPAERLNILKRIYHRNCFRCHTCQHLLEISRFGVIDGVPYCNPHHKQALNLGAWGKPDVPDSSQSTKPPPTPSAVSDVVKCYSCGTKVYPAEQLNILKRTYHRNCFRCGTCQKVLDISHFGVHEDIPYCEPHHKQALNLLASSTTNLNVNESVNQAPHALLMEIDPIRGELIVQPGANRLNVPTDLLSHPTDFATGISEKSSSPSKTRCFVCKKFTSPTNALILSDRVYHADCMKCHKCLKPLGRWNYKEIDGFIYCPKDHAELLMSQVSKHQNPSPSFSSFEIE